MASPDGAGQGTGQGLVAGGAALVLRFTPKCLDASCRNRRQHGQITELIRRRQFMSLAIIAIAIAACRANGLPGQPWAACARDWSSSCLALALSQGCWQLILRASPFMLCST